jgi:hypothetical protein
MARRVVGGDAQQTRSVHIELRSFTDAFGYRRAIGQAARYARQLGSPKLTLVFFIEAIDDTGRSRYEATCVDAGTGVQVAPIFVETA